MAGLGRCSPPLHGGLEAWREAGAGTVLHPEGAEKVSLPCKGLLCQRALPCPTEQQVRAAPRSAAQREQLRSSRSLGARGDGFFLPCHLRLVKVLETWAKHPLPSSSRRATAPAAEETQAAHPRALLPPQRALPALPAAALPPAASLRSQLHPPRQTGRKS